MGNGLKRKRRTTTMQKYGGGVWKDCGQKIRRGGGRHYLSCYNGSDNNNDGYNKFQGGGGRSIARI